MMNKKNYLILMLFIIWSSFLVKGQDVTYSLTNPRTTTEGADNFFLVDVLTYSNLGFKLGSGQLYFNYDTLAFGPNVFNSGALEIIIPDSSILDRTVGNPPFVFNYYGNFITNDNIYSRFSFSWQHDFSHACLDTVNIDYYSGVLFTLKMKFLSGQSGQSTGLCLEGGSNYIDQTFTACGPSDCNTNDCFNNPGTQLLMDYYLCEDCRIVYSTADSGEGTLREAISCAIPGDTIRFAPNLKIETIGVSSSEFTIEKDINILARKDLAITVSGAATNRLFNISAGNEIIIEGLTLLNGNDATGNCILNFGTLTLRDLRIEAANGITPKVENEGMLTIEGTVRVVDEE